MKRVEPVSAARTRRGLGCNQYARVAGLTLALGLTPTCALATTTCTVSTPGLAFGSYNVFAAGATKVNATLSIKCTLTTPPNSVTVNYTISLSTGSSNSFVQRQMTSGANTLGYNLYTSNAYSVVWGDGTGTTKTVAGSMSLTSGNPTHTNTNTVYGQIPALQDVAVANNYSDNVTVTVTY